MATESGTKRNVTSGTIEFHDRLTGPLRASVPVREPKHDEAVELMKELQEVLRKHYLASNILNPVDVARCAESLSNMWGANNLRIVEEKYSVNSRWQPR